MGNINFKKIAKRTLICKSIMLFIIMTLFYYFNDYNQQTEIILCWLFLQIVVVLFYFMLKNTNGNTWDY